MLPPPLRPTASSKGTDSLKVALARLGFGPVYHMKELLFEDVITRAQPNHITLHICPLRDFATQRELAPAGSSHQPTPPRELTPPS